MKEVIGNRQVGDGIEITVQAFPDTKGDMDIDSPVMLIERLDYFVFSPREIPNSRAFWFI